MAELSTARILVAVSGGPDSTALLLALHEAGRDVVAAHFDHALREGSDQVAREVAAMCAGLGVPVIAERRTEPLPKGSLQAAARTLRYAFLDRALAASTWHDVAAREASQRLAAGPLTGTGLRALSDAAASAALQLLYVQAGGSEPGLSRAHIAAMRRLAEPGPGGRGVDLPGGLRFRIVGDLMQVVPSRLRSRDATRLDVRACAGCADGHAAHLRPGLRLSLGFRRPGLRMRPVGGRGTRKVQDIFVDARVPREERDGWPLVFAGERLAWIPGIAIEADLTRRPEERGLHVTVTPMPVASAGKIARLETPKAREEI